MCIIIHQQKAIALVLDFKTPPGVFEAAERRAFFRNAVGIERVDFNNPAEAVRLVWLFLDLEAVEVVAPGKTPARDAGGAPEASARTDLFGG